LANGQRLLEEYKTIATQIENLEAQVLERTSELNSIIPIIEQYRESIPLTEQRLKAMETLYNKKMVGMNEYLSIKEHQIELHKGLESQEHRLEQVQASIESAAKQLAAYRAESLAKALTDLDELTRQAEAIDQELAKVRDLRGKQILYSPVKGTIKGLQANTVGGVVSPGQVLMEVVPLDAVLEVEAFLSNKDIGYVRPGQSAEIKVATFLFTKYGVINAEVSTVADDATEVENRGLLYRVRLKLEKSSIYVDGRDRPLLPGMEVSAEIAIGKRRVIEYILDPVLRMKDESIRER
jgi:hemolysin D